DEHELGPLPYRKLDDLVRPFVEVLHEWQRHLPQQLGTRGGGPELPQPQPDVPVPVGGPLERPPGRQLADDPVGRAQRQPGLLRDLRQRLARPVPPEGPQHGEDLARSGELLGLTTPRLGHGHSLAGSVCRARLSEGTSSARQSPLVRSVAIAATGPVAVDAGLGAVRAGGNAVDAAIAAMMVAMTTEPGIVSPMGGAYVTIWPPGGEPEVIDGNVEMPGRGLDEERFGNGLLEFALTYGGGITVYAGPGSVATPGAFAAMGLAHERHGAGAWSRVLHDAVKAARNGFHIGSAAASYLVLTTDNIFGWDEQTHAAVTRADGSFLAAGDRLINPDLAESLELIAEKGWREVYTGEIGRALAADQAGRGGLVTADDLAAYEAVVRTPLRLQAGEWDIATNPP